MLRIRFNFLESEQALFPRNEKSKHAKITHAYETTVNIHLFQRMISLRSRCDIRSI